MARFVVMYAYGGDRVMTERVEAHSISTEDRILRFKNANGQTIAAYHTWIKVDRA